MTMHYFRTKASALRSQASVKRILGKTIKIQKLKTPVKSGGQLFYFYLKYEATQINRKETSKNIKLKKAIHKLALENYNWEKIKKRKK
jgi:hypothetical protein